MAAFWPQYLSQPSQKDIRFHFHALAMATWCALLITQAVLIRIGKRQIHQRLGRVSYVAAPAVALSILVLNHHRSRGVELDPFRMWFFTSNIGDALLFLATYLLAMRYRHAPGLHARYMVCTAVVFVPAIFDRVLSFYVLSPVSGAWSPALGQLPLTTLLSYVLVGVFLAIPVMWDRVAKRGTAVFAPMMGVFAIFYMAPFVLIRFRFWKEFLAWYLSMPFS